MNGNLELRTEKKNMKKYIMDILSGEEVRLFLPVNFIFENDSITVQHRIEEIRPLKMIKQLSAEEAMDLLLSFFRAVNEAEKHYIFCNDYNIDENYIYVDRTCSEVRVCFLPSTDGKSINDKIIDFANLIEGKMSEEGREYIFRIKSFIEENQPGDSTLYRYICNLNREIYLCGIK